jgi:hypothetical protein
LQTVATFLRAIDPLCRAPAAAAGGRQRRARDGAHREGSLATAFQGCGKFEISHFKGLGEMPARNQHDGADRARAGAVPSTNARAG